MKKNIEQEVIDIIEEVLEVSSGTISFDTVAESIEEWDSLGHLGILTALNDLFEGRVADISEVAEATSVPKILDILKKYSLL